MPASSITIVTKDTAQSYLGGSTAAAKGTALSVLEVDSNFINLKEGILVLENTVNVNFNNFNSQITNVTNYIDTEIATLTTYVNSNFVNSTSPSLTGVPTSPDPGGSGSSQIQTVGGVNLVVSPISAIVNDSSTGNAALYSLLNTKAPLASPQLTGFPRLTGSSYDFSTWDGVTQYLAPVEYVQDKLENLSGDVKPTSAGGADLGTATEHFNELHVNAILPAGSNATIGTPTNRFPFGYFDTGDFGPNTILVGDAEISADGSTLVVPVNTAIGEQDNVLPLNIASTTVDKRFGELSLTQALDQTFTASGAITARDPVAINENGTVSTISSSVSNLNYVGIALSSAADAGTLSVRVHGEVSGFTGLTDGDTVFIEDDGSLVQTKTTTALKIGTAISTTEIFFFTTSNLDTYLLNINKAELGDFSASNSSTASGTGGISYDSATGQFTFTPADTTSFATTSYVDTEIANLVNSAPTSLDTLDELAAALNDDANFASTVTNSIATKAPLASPALTGTPTAPTASSGTNTTQIATTAYVQSELSGLGNASLTSFSVSTGAASGGGSLAYNNTNGVFTFAPADLSNVLTSYTETDPVVGAINGIVKADGNGNISAAVAGTDYSTFDGAFSSLTGTPTTVSGYGITDAAPLASPTFTGTPSGPTATSGTNTTQLATTAFVQSAVSGSSGIALTDLSVTTNAANAGGALSYNDATGVFTFVPADRAFSSLTGTPTTISGYGITDAFDGAFSSLTGTPTTISGYGITDAFDGAFSSLTGTPTTVSGYGITDAAPLASPTFTGTPAAPTAASGTNTTQLATTAFVQGEISGFSSTGGDSQRDYTASGSITDKNAVVLNSDGTVSNVSVISAGFNTATRPLTTATNNSYLHSGSDWNSTDNVYHHAYRDNTTLYIKAQAPSFSALTLSTTTTTTTSLGGTANSSIIYKHIEGTSTGILFYNSSGWKAKYITYDSATPTHNIGSNTLTLTGEPYDVVIKDSGRMFILYSGSVASVAIDASTKTFTLTDTASSTLTVGSGTHHVFRLFWDTTQSKIIVFKSASSTNEYQYITESSGSLTASSSVTDSNTAQFHQIEYHPGLSTYFAFRWTYVRSGSVDKVYPNFTPLTIGSTSVTYGSEVQASISIDQYDNYNQYTQGGDMRFLPSSTDGGIAIFSLVYSGLTQYGQTDQGRERFAFGTLNSLGTYSNTTGFAKLYGNNFDQTGYYLEGHQFSLVSSYPGYAFVTYPISYGSGGNTTKIASTLVRSSSVSNANEYLGIAQNAASNGGSVTVMLAGGISTGHSSLTQNVKYYVQNDGTIATTSSSTVAGHSVSTDSIQVADSQGVFASSTAFADLTSTPTTLSGYGITDAISSAGDVDIGSSDFITTGKAYFANMFATTGDLPSATTYHGMFAHVHGTGAGYFAHAGNWVELANKSYVDTEVANIVNSAPATLDTLDELAAALNDDANFATTVTTSLAAKAPLADPALTGTPTAPTATSGTNTTQIATTAFVAAAVSGLGGGGASVTTSDAAPSSPSAGDLWYNTDAGGLFLYYTDADSSQWVEVVGKTGPAGPTGAAGGSTITVSDIAPSSPVAGQLWWNSTSNKLYIYYTDANSSQWVQATTPGADGADGAAGADGADGASPGRNKFINGNFDVWQRGASRTTSGFASDRWRLGILGNSQATFSQQSFTLGQTEVPFNPKFYQRAVVTAGSDANSYVLFNQRIEDVRTFQGETVTVSFWAKADAAKDFALEPYQSFGTGGSPSAAVPITPQTITLSTTWTKYTKTFTIPSITGTTLGTDFNSSWLGFFFWLDAGSNWNSRSGSLGNQSGTFDFAQIQVEAGTTATDFETEALGITVEKCQRYFVKLGVAGSGYATGANQTASAVATVTLPTRMRAVPTVTANITQGALTNTGAALTTFNFYNTGGGLGATSTGSGRQWWGAEVEFNAET